MAATCEHCATPLPSGRARYCCVGCQTVAQLLDGAGLSRYYALGGRSGGPVATPSTREHLWLDGIERRLASSGHVLLDVQGMRCAACTWLLEETFRRRAGGRRIEVDPGLGRIALWASEAFDLRAYVLELESFGYVLGPADKTIDREESDLLLRAGIATALAMNVMSFSIAEYLGLSEEPLRGALWSALAAALATGRPLLGAIVMLAFAVASSPALYVSGAVARTPDPWVRRGLGVLLCLGAVVSLARPLIAARESPTACHADSIVSPSDDVAVGSAP